MNDVIVTAAIVGAEVNRKHTPYLPITPEEIAKEAKRCQEAGAAIIHLHVRDEHENPTQDVKTFQSAINAIRNETNLIIQISTGGAVGTTLDERIGPLKCQPEMASLNCGSINFGNELFENKEDTIEAIATEIRARKIVPELEFYELGHLDNAIRLHESGLIDNPLHIQWVLGVKGAMMPTKKRLAFLIDEQPKDATWSISAIGRYQYPMLKAACELGGNLRTGIEDNIYLEKGVLSKGSAPLVEQAVQLAHEHGRNPASPDEARKILKLI